MSAPTALNPAPIIVEGISEDSSSLAAEPDGPTCPHCGQSIDYKVESCPHCKATLSTGLPWPIAIIVAIIGIAIVLWMTWPR
jgi:hypothetical protein